MLPNFPPSESSSTLFGKFLLLVVVLLSCFLFVTVGCGGGDCSPGATVSCTSGGSSKAGIGTCRAGTQTCGAEGMWGKCTGEILPVKETCDGKDNNCDGKVDEDCDCLPGAVRGCYDGPDDTSEVGECRPGIQACEQGKWSACKSQNKPREELCNGLDDDCDGEVDESLSRTCFSGAQSQAGKGSCKAGTQVCEKGSWTACKGEITTTREVCDGKDNDCDGKVDNGLVPPPCAKGKKGVCRGATQSCGGEKGWIACTDSTYKVWSPNFTKDEGKTHCDGLDNDCDGQVDENCACVPGSQQACFSGKKEQQNKGQCKDGIQFCSRGVWSRCLEQVLPTSETCNDKDDDCDGKSDEGSDGKPLTRNCYEGDSKLLLKGLCKQGQQTCSRGTWSACSGQVLPTKETCNNKDDDCDGSVDEGVIQQCYTGPKGTGGVGICTKGTQVCAAGAFGPCVGQGLPQNEICNRRDDDCDGLIDEVCPLFKQGTGTTYTTNRNQADADAQGNIYYVGSFKGVLEIGGVSYVGKGRGNLYVSKMSPAGQYLWTTIFHGDKTTPYQQFPYNRIRVNSKGEVYVLGMHFGTTQVGSISLPSPAGKNPLFLAKLDAQGQVQWAKSLGSRGDTPWYGHALHVDKQENVFVYFRLQGTHTIFGKTIMGGNFDGAFLKVDGQGKLLWSQKIMSNTQFSVYEMETDTKGDLVFVGTNSGTLTMGSVRTVAIRSSNTFLIGKLSGAGKPMWLKNFGSSRNDTLFGLSLDKADSIYVTGYYSEGFVLGKTTLPRGQSNGFVGKFTSSGTAVWALPFASTEVTVSKSILVGPQGKIWVALFSKGKLTLGNKTYQDKTPLQLDTLLVRLDPASGKVEWSRAIVETNQNVNWIDSRTLLRGPGNTILFHGTTNTILNLDGVLVRNYYRYQWFDFTLRLDASSGKVLAGQQHSTWTLLDAKWMKTNARGEIFFAGNITATHLLWDGNSAPLGRGKKPYLVKLNPQGELSWALSVPETLSGNFWDALLQPSGEVIAIGDYGLVQPNTVARLGNVALQKSASAFQLLVVKISAKGQVTAAYTGSSTKYGYFRTGIPWGKGAMLLGGRFESDLQLGSLSLKGTDYTGVVAVLDGSGKWSKALSLQGSGRSYVLGMAPDGKGGAFVSGVFTKDVTFAPKLTFKSTTGFHCYVGHLSDKLAWTWVKTLSGDYCLQFTRGNLVPDGKGNFYYHGSFRGTLKVGAKSVKSIGDQDGFLARFDSQGKMELLQTFGGKLKESELFLKRHPTTGELWLNFLSSSNFTWGRCKINGSPENLRHMVRLNSKGECQQTYPRVSTGKGIEGQFYFDINQDGWFLGFGEAGEEGFLFNRPLTSPNYRRYTIGRYKP